MELEKSNIKEMFGVEHCYDDGASTYEIFETFSKAEMFCETKENWNKVNQPLFIFKANFNTEHIYKENDGWNYDDFSNTILDDYEKIKTYNTEKSLPNFIFN